MSTEALANLILIIHFVYVLAVIVPVPLIPIGYHFQWRWIRAFRVRAIHAGMMGFVLLEVLAGIVCPLTWLENALLEAAGKEGYQDSFIGHWITQIMYWNAPAWVFVLGYAVFFALIVFLWRKYPPRK